MSRGLRRRRSAEAPSLNVTAFMNLMVVLVPFLLLSAVFSEITIHDLSLPAIDQSASQPPVEDNKLVLEVVIRQGELEVMDRNSGRLKLIPNVPAGHDFAALTEKLVEIKAAFPDAVAVTLLLEPDIPYNTLIATMDAVRTVPHEVDGKMKPKDLFPDVSIGDAPAVSQEAGDV